MTYIIDAIRTPIGNFGGTLKEVRTDDLGAIPIKELIKRTGIDTSKIDDVILGCANQAGEDNRNIARMSLLLAGLPFSVPGETRGGILMQHFWVRPRLTTINKIGCVLMTCPPQAENFDISRRQSIDFYCKKHNFNMILHLKIPKFSGLRPAAV